MWRRGSARIIPPTVVSPVEREAGDVGMMITGRHFDDLTVLQVADAVEKSGGWKGL